MRIPPILLEGDEPAVPPAPGPIRGQASRSAAPVELPGADEGGLPARLHTRQLLLLARDPHCLYAQWDASEEQQQQHQALAEHRQLVLRMYAAGRADKPVTEVRAHPQARHWFIYLDRAGTQYIAEVGYYQPGHHWRSIVFSKAVAVPRGTVSRGTAPQFATISRTETGPLVLKPAYTQAMREWTPAQERALAEALGQEVVRQEWLDSGELVELVQRHGAQGVSGEPVGQGDLSVFEKEGSAVSSPV